VATIFPNGPANPLILRGLPGTDGRAINKVIHRNGAQKLNNFGIKYLPGFSRVELKHGR
jgi:hypothetical protein